MNRDQKPGEANTNVNNEWERRVGQLEHQVTALEALQQVARSFTSELDLDRLLSQVVISAVDVMQADAGSLLLFDVLTNELVFRVVQGGTGEALLGKRFPSDQGVAGAVFTSRVPCIVNDVALDDRFLHIGDSPIFTATSLMAVPLIHQEQAIGVIEVLNKKSGEPFSLDDQELLLAFAAQSAIAIENARLYHQVVSERDRILAVEEQVRRELARNLHDGPSQLLSAIIMNLRFLKQVLVRTPARAPEEIANIEQLSAQALRQVRDMLFDLRPIMLETEGLAAALMAYADRQRDTRGAVIHLDAGALTMRFPAQAEAAIFSILQEAIGNVRKHAQAKNIWVTARQQNRALVITVQDDGSGFDLPQVEASYAQRGSLGLLNMKERAEIAHGTLAIRSERGKGTLVTLRVPLPSADAGPANRRVSSV